MVGELGVLRFHAVYKTNRYFVVTHNRINSDDQILWLSELIHTAVYKSGCSHSCE